MLLSPLFSLLALLQAPPAAPVLPDSGPAIAGTGAPTFTIPRIDGDDAQLRIDGVLDERVWRRAARLTGFHGFQPVDGRPAEERTEVRVWYSATAIHFGIIADDRSPASIRATMADRDNIDQEDRVTIYLDTFDDRRRAFVFSVNPLGVQQDGVRSEGASNAGSLFGGSVDLNPDYRFESKGRVTDRGYEVEVRIPFKSLRYPAGSRHRWGINITRNVQRTGYEDAWTDVRRGSASFLAQSAVMEGLRDLERGVVVEAQPFVTASATGERDSTDAFVRSSVEPSVGANLRFGFSNASLDATINPDFSQVESDAGLVTANERFALFVPEKRPFFLEGIELFATPNQLVYTRQIVDPDVGAKVTGKFGAWGVAYLSALDRVDDRDALFNIARMRRDVGTNSLAGITVTDRRVGGDYNTVVAGDARIVFAEKYYVEGQLGGSSTRRTQETRRGLLYKAEFDRTGRYWGFNYQLNGLGNEFESQSGFVPRNGIVNAHAYNRFSWYAPRPRMLVENVTAFFGPSRVWRYDDFGSRGAIEGEEFVNLTARLRGGWSVESRMGRSFAAFDPAFYAGWEVEETPGSLVPFVPPDEVSGLFSGSVQLSTPVYRRFNASAQWEEGAVPIFNEGAEGRERRITVGVTARPSGSVRAELTTVASRITRERDGSEFARTVIPRLRVEYQPTRALFFRAVSEYQARRQAALVDGEGRPLLLGGSPVVPADDNGLRSEWLVSFEPTPGTAAYLGYATQLRDRDPFALSGLRATGDGVFVKVAYQFRR